MVIGDILEKLKLRSLNYGGGVYNLEYPACYMDGTPITIAVKLEMETEVVLERDEEQESQALLSTSDEYTILDLGSVTERFSNVNNIENIISSVCDKYHVEYSGGFIKLGADTQTTVARISRFVKCVFEIEQKALEQNEKDDENVNNKFMEYLNNKVND